MEVIFFILIVLGVMLLTTVLFGGWLLVKVITLTTRGIMALFGMPVSGRQALTSHAMLRCPRPRCHAENVPSAKFCRRCGVAMTADRLHQQHVNVRRAAMF